MNWRLNRVGQANPISLLIALAITAVVVLGTSAVFSNSIAARTRTANREIGSAAIAVRAESLLNLPWNHVDLSAGAHQGADGFSWEVTDVVRQDASNAVRLKRILINRTVASSLGDTLNRMEVYKYHDF